MVSSFRSAQGAAGERVTVAAARIAVVEACIAAAARITE
jgi:hypothetical protein